MEEDENCCHCIWPRAAAVASKGNVARKTLNEDAYNVMSEEVAMEECKHGLEVCREFLETELVVSSCGGDVEGTPDGGFEESNGSLTLVQVVRVPLLPEMDCDEVADVLYDTVLTKIVKSQTWMKSTCTFPANFIIFCWLPPVGAYQCCLESTDALLWTESLIWNVRAGGWPFSLQVQVPDDPGGMFPSQFGKNKEFRVRKNFFQCLSYSLNPKDYEVDEDPMEWYLFDEDCEENTLTEENIQAMIIDLDTLRAFIQLLEQRDNQEEQPKLFAVSSVWEEQTDYAALDPFFARILKRGRAREGSWEARESSDPPVPSLIEGLGWWDGKIDGKPIASMPGKLETKPPNSPPYVATPKHEKPQVMIFLRFDFLGLFD